VSTVPAAHEDPVPVVLLQEMLDDIVNDTGRIAQGVPHTVTITDLLSFHI
jgi:hypothetical protein